MRVLAFFILTANLILPQHLQSSCNTVTATDVIPDIKSTSSFKPDIHITQATAQDQEHLEKIRELFFEVDNTTANPQRVVYTKAIKDFGAQEVMLLTDDNVRISTLYFKRKNAPLNLIYVPGYFFDLTPTKEWCSPLALLFEDFNILSIDWRGAGASEGLSGFFNGIVYGNSFGANAYPDIQAAIDFMSKENNKPIILIGFCFGAAMAMLATIQAQKAGKPTADALVLNCIFSKFENQFNRAAKAEDRCFQHFLLESGIGRTFAEWQSNGDLFAVNPIDLIKEIKIPCYFEHFTYDPFAILSEGIAVYQTAQCPKMFMQTDLGKHVRMHTKVPYQYRNAFLSFLHKFGFLQPEFCQTDQVWEAIQTLAAAAPTPAAA